VILRVTGRSALAPFGKACAIRGQNVRRPAGQPTPEVLDLFWKNKKLKEMSEAEWESLCDGCGRCCLEKLEDEDTGAIYFTNVCCQLFDEERCTCKDYPNRSQRVEDCVRLTPDKIRTLNWLPPSCAYRLLAEGRDLYWWHPLVSGDPTTVEAAGISVRGRIGGRGDEIATADLEDYIVRWPGQVPKKARGKVRPR
jgi:uncharacterized cysteine cluster protein YcgN (CxxCxxCC family)